MKKLKIVCYFLILVCFVCSLSSCGLVAQSKLKDTKWRVEYGLESDEVDEDIAKNVIGFMEWEFTGDSYPYVTGDGYFLNISEGYEFSSQFLDDIEQSGLDKSTFTGEYTTCSGWWKATNLDEIFVNVPAAGHSRETLQIELDSKNGTLRIYNESGDPIELTLVED